jgi:hypothetical protein
MSTEQPPHFHGCWNNEQVSSSMKIADKHLAIVIWKWVRESINSPENIHPDMNFGA